MNDQKLENSLNLALEATKGELEKSAELEAGFDRESGNWELIVRYNGDLEEALAFLPEVRADFDRRVRCFKGPELSLTPWHPFPRLSM